MSFETDHSIRVARFEEACRSRGIPVTVQRRTVFEALLDNQAHPTADEVYEIVRRRLPDVSRTTVYRILETFVQLGLVMRVCHPGSAVRFDPKMHQHHHLVCTQCEKILDFEDRSLDQIPLPNTRPSGFEIQTYHIHFRGLCAECRGKGKSARAPAAPGRRGDGKPENKPTAERKQRRGHAKGENA